MNALDLDTTYEQAVCQDGFAIVESVIYADAIFTLRDAIAAIPRGEEVRRKRSTYGVRNLLEVCPAVRELSASPPIRRLVTPILGEGCFAVRAVFFDKTPDANWKLGWHQDSVITVQERIDAPGFLAWSCKAGVWHVQPPADVLSEMLAIRVHLDDCDETNGPLRVLPASHQNGWLDDEIDAWKEKIPPVSCHVSIGGVVAMRPLLLHASTTATRPSHRRVIHIEFAHQQLLGGLQWNQRVVAAEAGASNFSWEEDAYSIQGSTSR